METVFNKTNISRLKTRYEKLHDSAHLRGRLSLEPKLSSNTTHDSITDTPLFQTKSLRFKFTLFDKDCCVICQKKGGKLHKVSVF